jgi:hypothetical protein
VHQQEEEGFVLRGGEVFYFEGRYIRKLFVVNVFIVSERSLLELFGFS